MAIGDDGNGYPQARAQRLDLNVFYELYASAMCGRTQKKEIGTRIYLYIYDTHYQFPGRCAFILVGGDGESLL